MGPLYYETDKAFAMLWRQWAVIKGRKEKD